jgi:AraC-like DNA-binding protein
LKPKRQWEFLKSRGVSLEQSFSIGKMKRAMEGFLDECAGNSNSRNGDAIKYSELILSSLFQSLNHNPLSEEQTQKQELEELWRNVGSNVGHKWSVRLLAERISMSESSFKRAVVSHFETTPWEIVVRLRMETAQQLLKHSHYPLKIIAERTGYADPFIFSTAFKKFTGQTPRDFRKSGALAPYS